MELPGGGIEDGRIAVIRRRNDIGHLHEDGEVEGACDDGDMRGRAAILDDEAAQLLGIVIEKLGRPHVVSDENGVVRKPAQSRAVIVPLQGAQQPVGKVVEVVRALAPETIACLHELRCAYSAARARPPPLP